MFIIRNYDQNKQWSLSGSLTNNDTKATPCFQGDIFGDWREEVVARTADGNIRIYTSTIPTQYRIPTLLSDKQYRNAMVWQMNGYNQPPAVSYFLGELEGITQAPPAETNNGREEISNGATIGKGYDGKQILMAETGNMTVSVADGAAPEVFFDNAPTWVQGHDDNDNITTTTYTHTLTGGAFWRCHAPDKAGRRCARAADGGTEIFRKYRYLGRNGELRWYDEQQCSMAQPPDNPQQP